MNSLTRDLVTLAVAPLAVVCAVGTIFLASAQPLPTLDPEICATPTSDAGAEASFLAENLAKHALLNALSARARRALAARGVAHPDWFVGDPLYSPKAFQPGKLAVTGFLTRGRMGRFEDAIRLAQLTGQPADIAAVRQYRSRAGISFNLEQQLSSDLGFFARGGLAGGNVEPYEFTDVDQTIAAGLVLTGKRWGRPDDTIGLGGVINGISGQHEAFLNAGGLGILVGDGKLPNPGTERIVEMYYSLPVAFGRLTLDYQFIDHPAYNQDRGPVSIIGTRLRAQF
jgi:hypothetical protein